MTGADEPQTRTGAAGTAAPDDALMRELRLQRNLKILVGGLGILILAGLGAVVVRMASLATGRAPAETGSATNLNVPATGPAAEIALDLPKGARVVSISVSGDRLAVHHESPAGTGIAVIDVATGKRIADVRAREAP